MSEPENNSKFYNFAKGKGVMNLPNKLTILRVVLIPVFILFFYVPFKGHYFVALAVFAVASITDSLDGYFARKYNLVTNLGKFLDPVADKILVAATMIVMLTAPAFFAVTQLGGWTMIVAGSCVAVILARELIVSGFRMVAADAGIVIAADKIGKFKTIFQDVSLVVLLVAGGLGEFFDGLFVDIVLYVGLSCFIIATVLTIVSGVNYIIKNIEVLKR